VSDTDQGQTSVPDERRPSRPNFERVMASTAGRRPQVNLYSGYTHIRVVVNHSYASAQHGSEE